MIVKFGTAEPVRFNEMKLNLSLDARFRGTAEVSEYDKTLYPTEDDVIYAIRSNIREVADQSLNKNWPGEEVMSSNKEELLSKFFEEAYAKMGIHAAFRVDSFVLTEESDQAYKNARGLGMMAMMNMFPGTDPKDQPKLEDLTPEEHGPVIGISSSYSSHGMTANSGISGSETVQWQEDGSVIIEETDCRYGKKTYEKHIAGTEAAEALREFIKNNRIAEMEQIKNIEMPASMRMTDYSASSYITFTFDDGGIKVTRRLDCGSWWDVQRKAISRIRDLISDCITTGKCVEKTESQYDPNIGMIGLMELMASQPKPDAWKCSCGFEENTGRFCMNCGSPKPAGSWKCAKCGTENKGKFCENCGNKRPE
ncbi:MAG: zinc ribbon domain-containing protein [Lachnospiraceae bacterium]|nr:zinc ribbon domain-containing protein [Lachnospiraceae bacterium]